MNRKRAFILWIILCAVYYSAYRGALSHIIFYQEQHHLFLFSKEYFYEQWHTEGILRYLTDFVIQFFYHPAVGSALLSFLIASVYPLTYHLIWEVAGKNDGLHLSLFPSLGLFFYTMSADHSLTFVVGSFLVLLFLVVALIPLHRRILPLSCLVRMRMFSAKTGLVISLLLLALYGAGSYFYFLRSYNHSERIMLKAEQHVKQKEWEKVLQYTERYLNTGRNNQLISYFHHIALQRMGKLTDHLFDRPQYLGVKSLYFSWDGNSRESEYGHILYEELGYLNEAQRWEFEAMVVWGETAPHLLNLAKYNIANGRHRVAQIYINKLKQSLFYRDAALRLEEVALTGEVSGLRNATGHLPDRPARFANVMNIGPELEFLCRQDPTNRMAFDYLMAQLLLSNHIVRFAKNLKWIERFKDSRLPRIYEEALYIYKLGVSEEEFQQIGFTVSEETEQRFQHYYRLMQDNRMDELQARYGNTYWFYLNYVSPYGNKVIAE